MGTFGGLFAYLIGASFVLVGELGMTELEFGISFSGASVGFMGGAFLGSRIVRRLGIERMCLIGTAFTALAGTLILSLIWGGTVTAASVMIPTVIYFFGMGLSQPNIQAGAISPFPHMAGAAASLLGLAQYVSAGIFSIVIGIFAFDPTLLLATVMGGAGIFAFVIFATMIWLPMRR